ncbi:DUF5412 family protein [Halobacillus rhizosphaerae]|uniref:DUF5412 family protein n=1 Tax=Halobacillus rhizosphaerae TaxID=3064889 RepID=UPI00398B4569
MANRFLLSSIGVFLFSLCLSLYSLYSWLNHTWLVAPPNYVLLCFGIIALFLGLKAVKGQVGLFFKLMSWFSIIFSFLLSTILLAAFLLSLVFHTSGGRELIRSIHSPDGAYTIDVYRWDAGAAGSFGIMGERKGPLWFKKRIYYQRHKDQVEAVWENNHTVTINHHKLNLQKGETYGLSNQVGN